MFDRGSTKMNSRTLQWTFVLLLSYAYVAAYGEEVAYKVDCSEKRIRVRVSLERHTFKHVYLENLKGYPGCAPNVSEKAAEFELSLQDDFRCGVGKMTNKLTGLKTYFHRIILEEDESRNKETIFFKCQLPDHRHLNRSRGDAKAFPFDLVEPDHLNITEYIEARAPVPYLDIGIRQNGRLLDATYNVQPGTPLEMVIYLDQKSKATYGILNTFLKVSDSAGKQEEVIIMNGCSIDPYIFSNFVTPDNGDTLSATFKAFKFPESNYVMFSGTVSICINKCKGIPCGNGQYGFGRKKREIPGSLPRDPNAVYSVELSTMLKVHFNEDFFKLKRGAITGEFKSSGGRAASSKHIEAENISEQQMYTQTKASSNKTHLRSSLLLVLMLAFTALC